MISEHTKDVLRLSHRVVSAAIVEQFSYLDEVFSKKCSNVRKSHRWESSDLSGRETRVTEAGNYTLPGKCLIFNVLHVLPLGI